MKQGAMQTAAIFLAAGLMFASPAVAQSASDQADVAKIIDGTIAQLVSGKSAQAVETYFAQNALVTEKASERALIASQMDATYVLLGPISNCVPVETKTYGPYAVRKLYHCQHAKSLTRWVFNLAKTAKGWQGHSFFFDEKVFNSIDD